MEKNPDYRKIHKKYRQEMTPSEVETLSKKICDYLVEADWYQKAEMIFSYYPLGNEVSTLPFHKKIWEDGKILGLPRVNGDEMEFYRVEHVGDLEEGNFHIMEPISGCSLIEPTDEKHLVVIVPGLVFDEKGNRYGYGRGYYDRFFAKHPGINHRYALAFEHQMEKELPVQETDVPMKRIYTEIGCRRFQK
ncbi:MAG: 5-formyltetrahydrofolate cyclo-ligase [Roseburia sp.]